MMSSWNSSVSAAAELAAAAATAAAGRGSVMQGLASWGGDCGRCGHRRRGRGRDTGGGGPVRGGWPGARAGRPAEGRGAAGEPGRTAGKRRGDESVAGRVTRLGETKPAVEARPRIAIRIV